MTGGSDCLVKLWEYAPETNTYNNIQILPGHTDWVRDVAWSPTVLSKSYIASASQDKNVRIWTSSDLRKSTRTAFEVSLMNSRRVEVNRSQRRRRCLACELES